VSIARALPALVAIGGWIALAAPAGAAVRVVHHVFFQSPSRDIGCVILDGSARCDVVARSWPQQPRPAGCPPAVDFGQGLTVSVTGGAGLVCVADTAIDPGAPILPYGSVDAVGGMRCVSSPAGMTCRSVRSGHGFFISRSSYTTF
jgi:hypothetical protein